METHKTLTAAEGIMAKLYTNDQLVEGVDVELVKMNHETGEVHIKTADGEQLVVKDSQPAPDPDPTPNPEPEPDPEIPVEIVRASDYKDKQTEQRGYNITIPQGKVLASRIPANLGNGSVHFQQLESHKPNFNFWISREPGGPPVSQYCQTVGANFVLTQEFETGEGQFKWSCALAEDTEHYLNIKHVNPLEPASRINRKIY